MNSEWLVSMGPVMAPLAAFLAVFFAGVGILFLTGYRPQGVNRRLRQIQDTQIGEGQARFTGSSAQQDSSLQRGGSPHQEGEFLVKWLQPAGEMILPQQEWRRSGIKRQLVFAGYRQTKAIYAFLGAKLFTALALPLLAITATTFSGNYPMLFQWTGFLLVGVSAAIGFYLPDLVLGQIIKRRRKDFVESFPDALDMLVVCVEAGLGLDAAIGRVSRELRHSHPGLAGELSLIGLEVRAGKTRREAFQSLAERMEIEQVRGLATIIIQAERFGTSIGTALRNFSEEMRVERIQRARETAAKLPVKMIFPIMLFIFPALFLILLGPAIVQMTTGFSQL